MLYSSEGLDGQNGFGLVRWCCAEGSDIQMYSDMCIVIKVQISSRSSIQIYIKAPQYNIFYQDVKLLDYAKPVEVIERWLNE